jgi:hypothetical protein
MLTILNQPGIEDPLVDGIVSGYTAAANTVNIFFRV